jgi:hypothetical protein
VLGGKLVDRESPAVVWLWRHRLVLPDDGLPVHQIWQVREVYVYLSRELIWELLELTITDQLSLGVRKRLTAIVQLLQCFLRAAELEMRAAEEPLRSDLDVKGLKAQLLERIEELEEREREREELLAELVPAMESRGYDSGAVKAVMGG